MKRTRVLLIFAVLVLAALLTAGMCYADTIENGAEFTPSSSYTAYTITLNGDAQVSFVSEDGRGIVGRHSTCRYAV